MRLCVAAWSPAMVSNVGNTRLTTSDVRRFQPQKNTSFGTAIDEILAQIDVSNYSILVSVKAYAEKIVESLFVIFSAAARCKYLQRIRGTFIALTSTATQKFNTKRNT